MAKRGISHNVKNCAIIWTQRTNSLHHVLKNKDKQIDNLKKTIGSMGGVASGKTLASHHRDLGFDSRTRRHM
jgi:hypothetical protein